MKRKLSITPMVCCTFISVIAWSVLSTSAWNGVASAAPTQPANESTNLTLQTIEKEFRANTYRTENARIGKPLKFQTFFSNASSMKGDAQGRIQVETVINYPDTNILIYATITLPKTAQSQVAKLEADDQLEVTSTFKNRVVKSKDEIVPGGGGFGAATVTRYWCEYAFEGGTFRVLSTAKERIRIENERIKNERLREEAIQLEKKRVSDQKEEEARQRTFEITVQNAVNNFDIAAARQLIDGTEKGILRRSESDWRKNYDVHSFVMRCIAADPKREDYDRVKTMFKTFIPLAPDLYQIHGDFAPGSYGDSGEFSGILKRVLELSRKELFQILLDMPSFDPVNVKFDSTFKNTEGLLMSMYECLVRFRGKSGGGELINGDMDMFRVFADHPRWAGLAKARTNNFGNYIWYTMGDTQERAQLRLIFHWIGDGIAAETTHKLGVSWLQSLRPGDRFEAVLTQEQPRKAETGALTIKKFNIEIGEGRGVNEFSVKVEFLGEWRYVNGVAFTAVNCNEVAYEKYNRDPRDRFGDIESISINAAEATCRLETRMVQKKKYRLQRNTNGMPFFPPQWENGFFMRFQMSGRLTEDGMYFWLTDVGSGQAIDFGTVKLLRATR